MLFVNYVQLNHLYAAINQEIFIWKYSDDYWSGDCVLFTLLRLLVFTNSEQRLRKDPYCNFPLLTDSGFCEMWFRTIVTYNRSMRCKAKVLPQNARHFCRPLVLPRKVNKVERREVHFQLRSISPYHFLVRMQSHWEFAMSGLSRRRFFFPQKCGGNMSEGEWLLYFLFFDDEASSCVTW